MGIYEFIDDPFRAVEKGYKPSYLDCVSATSEKWFGLFCLYVDEVTNPENPLDLTLREILTWAVQFFFRTALLVTFPLSMWPLAMVQHQNIKHYIKFLKSAEDDE